jgi:hypothetical protein
MMILLLLAVLGLIACGVIWAAHACFFGLSLDTEIRPVEVLTLAVNIGIAVLLQYYFTNKVSDLRVEKDLLIDDIREVRATTKSCRDTLNQCYERGKIGSQDSKLVLLLFRRLINGIEQVEAALGISQCSKFSKDIEPIKGCYLDYKMASTGGTFPSKPYSQSTISEQERICRDLNLKLQSLIFRINKHH